MFLYSLVLFNTALSATKLCDLSSISPAFPTEAAEDLTLIPSFLLRLHFGSPCPFAVGSVYQEAWLHAVPPFPLVLACALVLSGLHLSASLL